MNQRVLLNLSLLFHCVASSYVYPSVAFAEEVLKPTVKLQGRIEQITSSNELPEIILRKQKPKLDSRQTLVSGTEVFSYPGYLIGRWGGNLKVVWSVTAADIVNDLPQHSMGNVGTSVLHFEKVSEKVKLLPTVIFFPIEEVPLTQSVINTTKIQADSLAEYKKQILSSGVFRGVPTLPLAKFDGEGLSGRKFISRVVHDSLRVLKPGTVEQDVVIADWKDGAFYNYREVVSRFIWYGKDKIYAQVMIANFGVSRQAISKTLLEGWMFSDWQPAANIICERLSLPWSEVMRRDGIE